jgi:hypothetical protein
MRIAGTSGRPQTVMVTGYFYPPEYQKAFFARFLKKILLALQ